MNTCGGPTDDLGATNGGLYDWNEGAELRFEDTVEVVGSSHRDEAVAVGELGEDTDVVGVLVLAAIGHV